MVDLALLLKSRGVIYVGGGCWKFWMERGRYVRLRERMGPADSPGAYMEGIGTVVPFAEQTCKKYQDA